MTLGPKEKEQAELSSGLLSTNPSRWNAIDNFGKLDTAAITAGKGLAHIWVQICERNGTGLPISRRKMHAFRQSR